MWENSRSAALNAVSVSVCVGSYPVEEHQIVLVAKGHMYPLTRREGCVSKNEEEIV